MLPTDSQSKAAQVVGIPDEHYGEVPVAVIKTEVTICKAETVQRVMRSLGHEAELKDVYLLSDLQLDDFPLNPTGKVMKATLRSEMLRQRDH